MTPQADDGLDLPASPDVDVLVIGGGNAGFCSAISAAESGAKRVLLIDACPENWAGGNSYFTAGAFRTVYHGLQDLLPIVNNVDEATAKKIDMQPYTTADFNADIDRICNGRSDPKLANLLINESNDAVKWLAKNGVRFQLSFNRQAYEVDGRFKFWGGMSLKTQDGGKGLIQDHLRAARALGIKVLFSTPAKRLVLDHKTGAVRFVVVQASNGLEREISTGSVILAAGGFEANPRMRAQYLGPNWDIAKVRGTPYNTGAVLELAMRDAHAKQVGNWSGCHSVAWDANAPAHAGDRQISNEFTKSGYPLGLMLNTHGERFVDEGVDLRNYTYAIFGKAILAQPDNAAFQVWDAQTTPWLRDEEYRDERVERIVGQTIEELARKCAEKGLRNPDKFLETIRTYNNAVEAFRAENPDLKWDPPIRDGLSTQSSKQRLPLAKSNWALSLTQGPFLAVKVTCGVTFTFGGLAVDPETAGVISAATNTVVPGLYCAGEMLGGLFYDNYPGGSGLTSGAVFGRRAGKAAAERASQSTFLPARL
ncbi:FAD/NAD(P)-binding domain-containing protein [Eremomyces bilateralis CBS 781.70]|uniref:FAD/NAD(P)-binding domain-containing protein n=1 Tax=Eremomyces bilateralis CBS 781.70 TaxID=1392243 RepID=A0A6G1FU44_9PEZI|nr:FAD/NAD(P)-binding domain-containing protein [Eremomyces bilateralis CBS 781.70]KAF1809228.1 FAD/NAD(P)-binding domain-containing protein [Eremomyces bilateralis CBS 781.70]